MREQNNKHTKGVELTKTRFDNAQSRIGAADTKVSVAISEQNNRPMALSRTDPPLFS